MKFADFHAGQVIEAGPYLLSEEELVGFARSYDPQWFHTDAEASRESPFGGLIASGWHTCAIAMRLVVEAALAGSESFASPGLEHVRWPNPVRPGDALRLVADVIEVRRSESKPTLGILRWRWRLFNQRELMVLDVEVTSLFRLRDAESDLALRHQVP
ncbi:MAG: MaoC family dehydratase [Hydrogenophaga sp.]|jgi:acyl dehydratase|uniref:MaoC family dehydratase n=1 Tax=Comamonadaceae TaxID=80864 RepID=UPI001217203B|nr:MaoC family dehydratase [Variovorax sp.]TAJ57134.1 MAG: MaoC family dehydratase [Variovorax sp.]